MFDDPIDINISQSDDGLTTLESHTADSPLTELTKTTVNAPAPTGDIPLMDATNLTSSIKKL